MVSAILPSTSTTGISFPKCLCSVYLEHISECTIMAYKALTQFSVIMPKVNVLVVNQISLQFI